ncbi:putative membrane protein [Bacteroides fragilis str. S38L5]|uniref:Transmembrane protein n=3 Tax=Bacteroides fragilis TaxID=817 RepID=A0ABN0BRX3_BACFG|nr:hypothetical protein BFAG_04312 [Bacteroides fragilis 3_1_12]EXY88591.1 putative membrane protein [Bacteroides fragilis str. 3998T(B)3]EXZ42591.1 putative membrane protein [Bacteroides fragilis str. 2-F-2 \
MVLRASFLFSADIFFLAPIIFITLLFQINPVIFSCYQRVL